MIIWILISLLLKMEDVWCMPNIEMPEDATKDLPELDQIDNFLESIQQRLRDGHAVIEDFNAGYNDSTTEHQYEGEDPNEAVEVTFTKAFANFLRLLVTKDAEDVVDVVKHSKELINNMIAEERLTWLTDPFKKVVINIAIGLSDLPLLQTRAALLEFYHEIKNRREVYGQTVNALFDKANTMVTGKYDDTLTSVLNEFQQYGRAANDGERLCRDIIDAFHRPFHDKQGTPELEDLINESNVALKERFRVISRKSRRSDDDPSFDKVKKRLAVLSHVEEFLGKLEIDVEDGKAKIESIYQENINDTLEHADTDNTTVTMVSLQTDTADFPLFSQDIRDMGYFTHVMQKLWSLFILKKQKDVGAVLGNIKHIINKKAEDGRLEWLGPSLRQMVVDTGNAFNNIPIAMIIHSALGFYKDLNNRHVVYTPEVNKIFNLTDAIYTEHDTVTVLNAIKQFEDYPEENGKTAREICEDVLDALLEPLRKDPGGVLELNTLLDNANQILNNDSRFKLVFFRTNNFRRRFSNHNYNMKSRIRMSRTPIQVTFVPTCKYNPVWHRYQYTPRYRTHNKLRSKDYRQNHLSPSEIAAKQANKVKLYGHFSKPNQQRSQSPYRRRPTKSFEYPRRLRRL